MNPSSLIKQQLKQKLKFTNKQDDGLAGDISNKDDITRMFTPSKHNPKTISILSFLNGNESITVNIDNPITYYHYPIDFLNKDVQNLKVSDFKKVNLCIFTVNTTLIKPFLQYLLNKHGDIMYWPNFVPKMNIDSESSEKLTELDIKDKTKFMGYNIYKKEVYMFYQLEDNYNTTDYYTKDSDFWWCTINEIILENYVLYYKIHRSVWNEFLRERRLLYLLDKKNLAYELPTIGFNGSHSHGMDYNVRVGISKANPAWASQGPYYYFANYLRAAKFGAYNVIGNFKEKEIDGDIITDNEHGRFKKGGIIRFVLFPSRVKVVMNRPWDKPMKQVPSLEKDIIDKSTEYKFKLYDSKGTWTKDYDSVFLGPLEIANNKYIHSGISWTVKSYFQYKPLSYHYFDKKTIPEKYNPGIDEKIDIYKEKDYPYFKII